LQLVIVEAPQSLILLVDNLLNFVKLSATIREHAILLFLSAIERVRMAFLRFYQRLLQKLVG